jgi:hypothetical protein
MNIWQNSSAYLRVVTSYAIGAYLSIAILDIFVPYRYFEFAIYIQIAHVNWFCRTIYG